MHFDTKLRRLCNTGMHQLEPELISLFLNEYFFSATKVLAYHIIHKISLDRRKFRFRFRFWNFVCQKSILPYTCSTFLYPTQPSCSFTHFFTHFFIIMYRISCLFCCICWCLWLLTKHININFGCAKSKDDKIRQYKTFILKSSFISTTKS